MSRADVADGTCAFASFDARGSEQIRLGMAEEHVRGKFKEIGKIASPDQFLVGRDDWIFLGNSFFRDYDQALGVFDPGEKHIDDLADWVNGMDRYFRQRNKTFIFAVAPAKWSIYSDKIPSRIVPGQGRTPSVFDRLLARLTPRPEGVIDLRPTLRKFRKAVATYSPLNSHWTDFGAYIAWTEISKHLETIFKGESFQFCSDAPKIEKVDIFNECAGLFGLEGENTWTRPIFSTPYYNYEFISGSEERSMQNGYRQVDLTELPMRTFTAGVPTDRKVLFVRDSFGNQISPFLTSAFRQTYQCFHHLIVTEAELADIEIHGTRDGLLGSINQFDPDVVIYMTTERYLAVPTRADTLWSSALRFEAAGEGRDARWPIKPQAGSRRGGLEVDGNPRLLGPVAVKLGKTEGISFPLVLNASFFSAEKGTIGVEWMSDGESRSHRYWINAGLNEIYVPLPTMPDQAEIRIVKHGALGQIVLSQITARPVASV